ncbi:collagenase [Shewanella sp. Scap07]|uniref:collagenase n=1 Tax=Shewanella sp. Scap07 TaxID=2589987 RepID=UPI0015B8C5FD|nr:collagenase [Shewanella sp. Scap07]QLE86309.1 collagenase [Shewanella sp. Scap07]
MVKFAPIILLTLPTLGGNAHADATAPLTEVLTQVHQCSDTIIIRSQALSAEQTQQACQLLQKQEANFHSLFNTLDKPVRDDNNVSMRANVYASRDDYVQYVTAHFDVPSDNGGMFLEGLPHIKGNQAEFVAYQKKGQIWNLAHEYVHYLDGRFNLWGDFCASLHDSHSAPEYCPQPAPLLPHLVWWSEGIAEYISQGDNNPKAIEIAQSQKFALSELFNTSYETNGGGDRVYRWGYLAVRYMMEQQRDKVETMLGFTRNGDYARYQALVKQWGTSMDDDFQVWLKTLKPLSK